MIHDLDFFPLESSLFDDFCVFVPKEKLYTGYI